MINENVLDGSLDNERGNILPDNDGVLKTPGQDKDKPFEITDNSDIDNLLDKLKEKAKNKKKK